MTDDVRVLGLLRDVLDNQPKRAPDRLLRSVMDGVERSPRRSRARAPRIGSWRWNTGRLLAVAAVVVAAAVAFDLIPKLGVGLPSPTASPALSPSPVVSETPRPSKGAQPAGAVAIEDLGFVEVPGTSYLSPAGLMPGTLYTSRVFDPWVTFEVDCRNPVPSGATCSYNDSEFCPPRTNPGQIVLGHARGCQANVQIVRPWRVECVNSDPHPGADGLAAALMANPGLSVIERDDSAAPLPGRQHRRVLEIHGQALEQGVNPEQCGLLADPGSTDRDVWIRGDQSAILELIDVDGELIVIRASVNELGAIDGVSVARHLLTVIHDIAFP